MKHPRDERPGNSWNTAGVVLILSVGLLSCTANSQQQTGRQGERKRQTTTFALSCRMSRLCLVRSKGSFTSRSNFWKKVSKKSSVIPKKKNDVTQNRLQNVTVHTETLETSEKHFILRLPECSSRRRKTPKAGAC